MINSNIYQMINAEMFLDSNSIFQVAKNSTLFLQIIKRSLKEASLALFSSTSLVIRWFSFHL